MDDLYANLLVQLNLDCSADIEHVILSIYSIWVQYLILYEVCFLLDSWLHLVSFARVGWVSHLDWEGNRVCQMALLTSLAFWMGQRIQPTCWTNHPGDQVWLVGWFSLFGLVFLDWIVHMKYSLGKFFNELVSLIGASLPASLQVSKFDIGRFTNSLLIGLIVYR